MLLTYPVWGTFLAFGLWSRVPPRTAESGLLLNALLLPVLLAPLPVWLSKPMGGISKVLMTIAIYAYAYVAFLVIRFAVACQVSGFSCTMG